MAKHTFRLSKWSSRLGIKGDQVPEIAPVVVPVQVVGDASLLVPTLLPPTAAYGGVRAAAAGNHATLQVQSRSDGGTLVRTAAMTIAVASGGAWAVQAASATFSASTVLTAQNYGPNPVKSVVTVGDVLVANILNTADTPVGYLPLRVPFGPDDLVYLPPTYNLVVQCAVANTEAWFELVIQDLEAALGPQ